MKKLTFLANIFMALTLNAQDESIKQNIEGKWLNQKKTAVIEIYEDDGKYFGKRVKIFPDENGELSDRKLGEIVLRDFEWDDDLYEGELYAPKRDEYFDCEISLQDENTLELSISVFLMSREFYWTRFNE